MSLLERMLENPGGTLLVCLGLAILVYVGGRLLRELREWVRLIFRVLFKEFRKLFSRGKNSGEEPDSDILAQVIDVTLIITSAVLLFLSLLLEKVPSAIRQALGGSDPEERGWLISWGLLASFLFFGIVSPVFLVITRKEKELWEAPSQGVPKEKTEA